MKAIIGALVCATLVLHALSLTIRVDIDVPQDLKTSTGDQTLPYNPAVESVFESSADTKLVTSMAQLTLLDGPGEDQHPITSSEVIGLKDQVCNGEKYSREAIRKAVEKGLDAHYSGDHCTKEKGRGICYPHIFKNYNSFPFAECVKDAAKTYEYPIIRGTQYDSGEPGTDRVIFLIKSDQKATFCGAITHAKATKPNDFTACSKGFSD